ncbi:MAG: gamma-glutamylcyclotransferase [Myxococcota bacterium]
MSGLPLFVYGTLRAGESQAHLLGDLGRRPAQAEGRLYHLPAGYPALVLSGSEPVFGELVDAPGDALLAMLDLYEGVRENLFQRVQIPVRMGLLADLAWAYVAAQPTASRGRHLPAGNWRSVRRGR